MYIHVHCNIIYIDKILKQPKCPSLDEWIKKLWYTQTYTYKRVLLSHKKGILAIYDNMDRSRGYYAVKCQSVKDIYHMTSHMKCKR